MDFNKSHQIFYDFLENGLDSFNKYMPDLSPYSDFYSERIKSILIIVISFSLIASITYPYGFLYAVFLRPLTINILILNRVPLDLPIELTPESGMHYLTLITYSFACYQLIKQFEKSKIKMPIHKLLYSASLTMLTFFVPFEYIYLALYDIFHNIPKYGYPNLLYSGWWMDSLYLKLVNNVYFVDTLTVIASIYIMIYVKSEIQEKHNVSFFKFDKISKTLLFLYIIVMAIWVIYPNNFIFGTKYFPQTIYPEWGYYSDYEITIENHIYGIVHEIWIQNNVVKILNHSSKALSVAFMIYTFSPRRKDL